MRRFTDLYASLDRASGSTEKLERLQRYFETAPPEDAVWALAVLTGRRVKRAVSTTHLRAWVAERSGIPLWMVEECYDAVGDLAETLALLLPDVSESRADLPLHQVMERWILPLPGLNPLGARERVEEAWSHLASDERFLFHKLLTGGFRVGVGPQRVLQALAQAHGIEPAVLAHRWTGPWEATPEAFLALLAPGAEATDPARPYPFFLAHPLEGDPEAQLGDPRGWLAEWKWDGIRAQILRREGTCLLWSRGEALITGSFPEIADPAERLPPGTVLDGELLAWSDGAPRPFTDLQRRLGRKRVGPALRREVPVRFLAYDLLEAEGVDLRPLPLAERRLRLEALVDTHPEVFDPGDPSSAMGISPSVSFSDWSGAAELRSQARGRGVEGLMLKQREAPYGVGRTRGAWWKWKVDPLRLDAVLLYARKGHGRRASLFTDFTFGIWAGEELVPIGSAYSGLTDAEFRKVDRWIRENLTERFGPVRAVRPELVFELAFEGVHPSTRHRSGFALRFPRMARWRTDKSPAEADTLETVARLAALLTPPLAPPPEEDPG